MSPMGCYCFVHGEIALANHLTTCQPNEDARDSVKVFTVHMHVIQNTRQAYHRFQCSFYGCSLLPLRVHLATRHQIGTNVLLEKGESSKVLLTIRMQFDQTFGLVNGKLPRRSRQSPDGTSNPTTMEKINSTSAARSEEPMQTTPMDTSMIEEINVASEIQENLPEELEPQEVIPATRSNPDNKQTRIAANNEETLTESNLDTVIAKPKNVTTDDIQSTSSYRGRTKCSETKSVNCCQFDVDIARTDPRRNKLCGAKDKSSSAKDADDDDIVLVIWNNREETHMQERALKKQENRNVKLKKWQDRAEGWKNTYTAQDFGHTVGEADEGNQTFPEEHVIIYTDGSFNVHGGYGGIGMFLGNDHPLELGLSMCNGLKSSFLVELFAIVVALCRVYCWGGYQGQSIILRTDCKNCLTAIANLYRTEPKGLVGNDRKTLEADNEKNLNFVKHILGKFPAEVVIQWVEAHSELGPALKPKHPGNHKADALAVEARVRLNPKQSAQNPNPREHKAAFKESEHQFIKKKTNEPLLPEKPMAWKFLLEGFADECFCKKQLKDMKEAEDNEEENKDDDYKPETKLGIQFLSGINV
ncbi:unnamed protein product, partial [Mesorhabditis belari]|uniref:RNase H type-1 domain-containing protein n=1 Tax=Mesorhabditis belari TaxID=2138241 RepID=A0AAF3J646_9BILA